MGAFRKALFPIGVLGILGLGYLGYHLGTPRKTQTPLVAQAPAETMVQSSVTAPVGEEPHTLVGEHPREVSGPEFPDTPAGRAVVKHLKLGYAFGEGAKDKYEQSLEELRAMGPEVPRTLHQAYRSLEEKQYTRRWQLATTLSHLATPETFSALTAIAGAPMPSERISDPEVSSLVQEAMIRTAAVEGIAGLAKAGSRPADTALLRFIRSDDIGVQRRAIRGYLSASPDFETRAALLRSMLPSEQHARINLDVTDVSQVPQPSHEDEGAKPPAGDSSSRMFLEKFFRFFVGEAYGGNLGPTCNVPASVDVDFSGDYEWNGPICGSSNMVTYFMQKFHMPKAEWAGGWGGPDGCRITRPFARMLNTARFMSYTAQPKTGYGGTSLVRTAFDFVSRNSHKITPRCSGTGYFADAFPHWYQSNNRIQVYPSFSYELSILGRAMRLVHEARHISGKTHNAGGNCKGKKSCDSHWDYNGANTYTALYGWWFFAIYRNGDWVGPLFAEEAKVTAQAFIDTMFQRPPGWVIY